MTSKSGAWVDICFGSKLILHLNRLVWGYGSILSVVGERSWLRQLYDLAGQLLMCWVTLGKLPRPLYARASSFKTVVQQYLSNKIIKAKWDCALPIMVNFSDYRIWNFCLICLNFVLSLASELLDLLKKAYIPVNSINHLGEWCQIQSILSLFLCSMSE